VVGKLDMETEEQTLNKLIGRAVAKKTGKCLHSGETTYSGDVDHPNTYFCHICENDFNYIVNSHPQYDSDLNAITGAVRVLCDTDELEAEYCRNVRAIFADNDEWSTGGDDLEFQIQVMKAKQKCEALRSIAERVLNDF
jgi:hypothetical protein